MATKKKLLEAAAGVGVDTGDDDFANVSLLLDFDGTSGDNNNTFSDTSGNDYAVTEAGTVTQGSISPYGDHWSNYFDGVDDYLITDTAAPAIGTSDFTIEFWYNGGPQPQRFPCIIGTLDAFSASGAWRVQTYNNYVNTFIFVYGTTGYTFNTEDYHDGVWRHFAVTREGTNLRGFVNGVQQGSTLTFSSSLSSRKIMMMSQLRDGNDQEGYVSNARVVNGTALYTSDFTPPTAPLTAVTGTDFLSCQSNRFIDNSSNNFTLSVTSAPKVSSFSPFKNSDPRTLTADGGSGYFTDGSAYLTASPTAPGTGDFCYECWINVPQGSDDAVWETRNANLSASGFTMTVIDADTIRIFSNNAKITANGLSYLNQWTHLCVEKVGSTTTMYINGTSYGTTTDFTNMSDTNFRVGESQFYGAFSGYIADFRYVRGAYVYNGNFTPPTEPLTAIANTEVLLGFQDAGIYDLAGVNNLDTIGNAGLGFAPIYGTGSLEFDGSSDSLEIPHREELNLGTGDSTIEFWVSLSSGTSDNDGIISKGDGSANTGWQVIWNNTNELLFIRTTGTGGSPQLESGNNTVYRDGVWHHVAITTASSTVRMFLNGTQVDSYTDTGDWDSTETLRLGTNRNNNNFMVGYLDDVRITKGIARYTSNFTPPTEIDLLTDTHAEYVTLMLDGDGTANGQNKTFTDSSTNNFTVSSAAGVVTQGVFSPYGDNWSNYFDVDLLSTSFTAIGSSDFTLEFWAMVEEDTTGRWFAGTGTGTGSFQIGAGSGGKWSFYTESNVLRFNGTTSIAKSTWYHVAVSRSGSTIKLFINGSEEASATDSVNYSATSLGIGGYSSTNASCYGYISNFRIVVGTALYTSAFTPPTAPLTAVTNTKLLTCQSNRFVDNSSDSNSISIQTGTPSVSRFSPFESDKPYDITTDGGSGYFEGTVSTSKLSIADATPLSPEGSDFTIEAWVYTKGSAFSDYQGIWIKWTAGNQEIFFSLSPTLNVYAALYIGGNINLTSSNTIEPYTWNHVALTRSGTTATLWINGNSEATTTVSGTIINDTDAVYIGGYALNGYYEFNGYISDVRWVKGTAVYTSAFTPPTAPLTAITNTETLLSFQDSAIPDLSGINNIYTADNAKVGGSDPTKYGSNSLKLDGSGDYLLFSSSEAFDYSTGDFTLECWVYKNANPSADAGIIEQRPASTDGNYPMLGLNSSGQLFYYVNSAYRISASASTALSNQAWDHVAYVRSGGNLGTLYINGTSVGTWSDTTDYVTAPLRIGSHAYPGGTQFNGFIDDLRITKGVARYTSNFTAPTEALPKF